MLKCNSEALILSSLQGRALLSRLHGLKSKGVQLKISSGIIDSTELAVLEQKKSQRFLPLSSHVFVYSPLLCSSHPSCFPCCLDSSPRCQRVSSGAEVHYVNMTALTKGQLLSSFWVVDKRHFYMGSASMDWRSLATVRPQTPTHLQRQNYINKKCGTDMRTCLFKVSVLETV